MRSQTAAAVDIAPPIGHAQGPGWDNSPPVNLSKILTGKEFNKSTSPPSKVPPIWFTVSGSFIYFDAMNLINKAIARTPPVEPNQILIYVSFKIPVINKTKDTIPSKTYECLPNKTNKDLIKLEGQVIGKSKSNKKLLNLGALPDNIRYNCFRG